MSSHVIKRDLSKRHGPARKGNPTHWIPCRSMTIYETTLHDLGKLRPCSANDRIICLWNGYRVELLAHYEQRF
jgi:hypothetical protein